MPVFPLNHLLRFPHPKYAEPDGLLAVGGDLSQQRLLLAYRNGIFPWYSGSEPLLWWSPNPRFVLFPEALKISKSMRQVLRSQKFSYTIDQSFAEVVKACQKIPRRGQYDTWITDDMLKAYNRLHQSGYAHSVEIWNQNDALVGGLYGVAVNNCFCGESMFARESNASKAGFILFVRLLQQWGFGLIDCQIHTNHLESLGATSISRNRFLEQLTKGEANEMPPSKWKLPNDWKALIP